MEAEPSSSHTLIHCSGAVCTDTLQRKFSLWRLLQSHSLSLILLPSSSRVLVSISFPSLFFSFRSISFLPSFAPYLLVSLSLSPVFDLSICLCHYRSLPLSTSIPRNFCETSVALSLDSSVASAASQRLHHLCTCVDLFPGDWRACCWLAWSLWTRRVRIEYLRVWTPTQSTQCLCISRKMLATLGDNLGRILKSWCWPCFSSTVRSKLPHKWTTMLPWLFFVHSELSTDGHWMTSTDGHWMTPIYPPEVKCAYIFSQNIDDACTQPPASEEPPLKPRSEIQKQCSGRVESSTCLKCTKWIRS